MEFPPELELIHQPARLRIMGLLYKQRDVSFTALRDLLGLSDGNLASHGSRLADAGYLEARRILTRRGFEMRFKITSKGSETFKDYLAFLRGLIEGVAPGEGPRELANEGQRPPNRGPGP